jgi:hypothetical protein
MVENYYVAFGLRRASFFVRGSMSVRCIERIFRRNSCCFVKSNGPNASATQQFLKQIGVI